jgi:hypothetical protein
MLGVAIVAAIALTGCDDALAEIQKGLGAAESDASKTELPSIAAGGNGISASVGAGFTVNKSTFTEVVADMYDHKGEQSASYELPGLGDLGDTYTPPLTLTTANSPLNVVIDGGEEYGWVVTGEGNSITVGADITLTLTNITFKNISFTVSDGGTLILDDGAVVRENTGTGVTVTGTSTTAKGTLNMRPGASITQNGSSTVYVLGAGVRLEGTGSTFTMSGGNISRNAAEDCGGVALLGTNGTFTMSGGEISGNTVNSDCGGVLVWGEYNKFYMNGGKISEHNAQRGGGILLYSDNCEFNMTDGEISNNYAAVDGAGVYIHKDLNAVFNMSGGVIKENVAYFNGGGVYIREGSSTFTMTGGEITGNEAGGYGGDPGIGGVVAPAIGGNPWIGADKAIGTGPGWIYDNTDVDV